VQTSQAKPAVANVAITSSFSKVIKQQVVVPFA